MQAVFNQMKGNMTPDAISAYLDHNMQFDIHIDASNYQLGACSMQYGRPV